MKKRVEVLEKKINRIEVIIWYIAGALSLKLGGEAILFVQALVG